MFLALVTVFRLWYCTQLELVGDEAYYWLWSKHLDYGYFSKGPGVAWTIALGAWLFGDTVLGIRFFAVLLAAGTSALIFVLARALFSELVAWSCVLLGAIVPLFAVGSILMTIDPLSVFFWSLTAVLFWRAKDEASVRWWILTGGDRSGKPLQIHESGPTHLLRDLLSVVLGIPATSLEQDFAS